MTKAAACFGKDSRKFFITQDTKDYIDALTPNVPKTVQLVETKRGNGGGTWAHPKLAVFFARWLDVRFAVWCDAMIEDILKGNAEVLITKPEQSAVMAYVSAADTVRICAKNITGNLTISVPSADYGLTIHPLVGL